MKNLHKGMKFKTPSGHILEITGFSKMLGKQHVNLKDENGGAYTYTTEQLKTLIK